MTTELVTIRILGLPLAVHARASEHGAELRREFALLVAQTDDGEHRHSVPAQLLSLIEELDTRFGAFTAATSATLDAALASAEGEIDLVYEVPRDAGPALVRLGELLDEADRYCEAGEHLLTLKTPDDLVRYRRWFLAQFVGQAGGGEPVRWADYAG